LQRYLVHLKLTQCEPLHLTFLSFVETFTSTS
jgi:hypothetical protein